VPGPTSTNWFVTDLGSGGVQLHGAGGAEGTPFVNILRGGLGDTSATGTGTDLLTYAADTGFRTLTPGEYTSTIPAGNFDLNRAPNIALAGAATIDQTTAITALKLDAGASLSGSGTALLAQSTVLATGDATIGVPSFSTNLANAGPSTIFLTAGASTDLTVTSILPGSAMGKYGEGTLLLNGRRIGGGPVALKQGTLTLGADGALGPLTQLAIDPGATFGLGGSDRTIGSLTHDGGTIGSFHLGQMSAGTVALGANRLTLFNISNAVFSGTLSGTGGFAKSVNSTGITTFTQPHSYTGSTVLRGGTLQLAGAGTLASSAIEVRGGTLLFNNTDDNAASGYVADRIGAAVPIVFAGGGITFTENANTPAEHQLGAMTLAGAGALTITNGATAPSTLTIANLSRNAARGTLAVNATNLGLAPSPIGGARIFLTQIEGGAPAAALLGGGGGVGSPNQSILPWAFHTGASSFLTYGAHGLRPLATSEYETNLLDAPTTADVNARVTAGQTLTAPRTVNSLLASGGVSGAHDLTLDSGALAVTAGGLTIGTSSNELLTGAGNSRELVVTATTGTTALDYNVATTGGVTKTGAGTLALGGTNSFTGGLAINEGSVSFQADSALGDAAGAIRFGGNRANVVALAYTGPDNAPLDFTRLVTTTSYGGFTGLPSHRWQIGGVIAGDGGIRYSTNDAVFELKAAHTYTGPTIWNGGHLYLAGDSVLGAGGELMLNAGTGSDIVLRGLWNTSRPIHASTNGGALQTNGFNATWSGQFTGATAFTKNGIGALNLVAAMPYSGPLTVAAGEVALRDRGSLAANASTLTVTAGATLTLDDGNIHASDRLHDSSGTVALDGGTFTVLGHGSVTTEEVLNSLTFGPGASTVLLSSNSSQPVIVRLSGAVTNATGAASVWRGTNLGANAPGTANSTSILLTPANTNSFPLVGGGAPAGRPSISIIAGGFGETNTGGLGSQLVTYDEVRGVRLLDPVTEYTTTLVNGSSVTDNVKADGTALALANATTINALWLKDGGSVTGAGDLTLRSGTMLVTGSGNTVAKPVIAGSNALVIGGSGNVDFTSSITSANFGGLIKTGAGTLTLSVANTYSGNTILKDGVLALGAANALDTTLVHVQGGEMRNVSGSPLTIVNDFYLNGTWKIGGAQDFTFNGSVILNNATREIETANTGTTTISGVVANSQSLINYGLTKTGPGLLVLDNAANTYDGPTTLRGGVLSVGTLADGSVGSIVNPSGIGQSWGDADQLVFDGGTLRYTGPAVSTDRLFTLTPNGGTIDASGTGNLTFSNTGSISAPGSGPRTLTLTGNSTTTNTMAVSITDGPTLSDAASLTVSTTHWQLTNANTFTGATTVNSGTLEAAAAGALGSTTSVAVNTGGTLLLSGTGNRINNAAAFNLNGGELDTGGTSEGTGTTIGLGALTLSASSIIDFTGAAATLTFASGTYVSGVLSINNWSGLASTAGIDGVNDRLIFAGDNTARLAFLSAFNQSSILFGGFGSGYTALQFDTNYFEVVPVPEPSGLAVAASLLGLIGWRERRRAQQHRRSARHQSL
jgi:autotransporter-associated beta strand protein